MLAAARLHNQAAAASALLLACPNADMTLSEPSIGEEGHGWGLDGDDLRWYVKQWIPDPGRRADPRAQPRSRRPDRHAAEHHRHGRA